MKIYIILFMTCVQCSTKVNRLYNISPRVLVGFGLPHTDENPYNANLGNCLGEFSFLVGTYLGA